MTINHINPTSTAQMKMKASTPSLRVKASNFLCLLVCFALTTRGLFFGVCHAANSGRLLPRLTVIIPFHAIAHWFLFASMTSCNAFVVIGNDNAVRPTQTRENCQLYSLYFMAINIMLNAVGYTIIILIYRHSIRVVFNRKIPTIRKDDEGYIKPEPHPAVQSFNTHLLMLRPLEILFRFITAPMRVLPDVIVIGETRCGTTNLCAHIVSLSSVSSHSDEHMKIKCYTPFCAWAHPILDHKESFYFVGHYLGIGEFEHW